MTTKTFPLHAALTGTTGKCIGDFSDFHRLADHFYPGIMTFSLMAKADSIKAHLLEQYPELPTSADEVIDAATAAAFLATQTKQHGETVTLRPIGGEFNGLAAEMENVAAARGGLDSVIAVKV